ncbi:hypothetical protein [Clostridium intestinale]|uniref:Uncharacterized protein n=1 Tax=Clostridium intestinale URNW TaxID=1294142 RepID=U2PPQ4_9CLOT|nr:hypothetical protein [Clostridium intestinale]ERK28420.1 hypothetical protein CINTURNW_4560 [Clostridium intestinale URNW]
MDKITKGTWIINSTKHLLDTKKTTLELNSFESTEEAGKTGILLGRLVADNQEIVSGEKLRVFARQSGISSPEMSMYAKRLKHVGMVDYQEDAMGKISELEVYCFSMQDAINVTTNLFEESQPSECEEASIISLQSTYELPRSKRELMEEICCKDIDEGIANEVLELQQTFGLVKSDEIDNENIFYNEYAFTGDAIKIKKAINNLNGSQKDTVNYVLDKVSSSQGYLLENFKADKEIDISVLQVMEGVGLLDGITVKSRFGEATFYTTPQLKGQGVGSFDLSTDVFHKAKILLSCLKFGQLKSVNGRGKIRTTNMMLNIINKLIEGQKVGPCTAIGQDYQLLELDGVISTVSHAGGMYYMTLRQKEVGILVKQMIMYNKIVADAEDNYMKLFNNQPETCIIPEIRKKQIEAKPTKAVSSLREKMLMSVRTGGRL